MTITLRWRPLDRWPREQTKNRRRDVFLTFGTHRTEAGHEYREYAPIPWEKNRLLLEKELRLLNVREAVVQLAIGDADIRIDGQIRANARPSHPGVVITFTAPGKGVLTYACDAFTDWQDNVRGIAKGLEALRLIDRYGIATSGEQYVGWKELPSGVPLSARVEAEVMSVEQAARVVVGWVSGPHDLAQNARTAIEDADYRRFAHRQALKHLHPDAGGDDSDAFLRLQLAIKTLDEND